MEANINMIITINMLFGQITDIFASISYDTTTEVVWDSAAPVGKI